MKNTLHIVKTAAAKILLFHNADLSKSESLCENSGCRFNPLRKRSMNIFNLVLLYSGVKSFFVILPTARSVLRKKMFCIVS